MIFSATQWAAIACVFGMSVGQVMFKVSAISLNQTGSIFNIQTFAIFASTLLIYLIISGGWVWVLRNAHLGEVFPFYSLAYALVPIASYYLFGERFTSGYFFGIILIMSGLILCAKS
ncbi:MAG: 4-amino-4-deoxy-L-arabinose-phospho-UDP flippase [Pseudomonadota bacterium]